jgi:TonB family protein
MNTFLHWLMEVNVSLVLFMTAYGLFLRNENQFSFKRIFLLGGMGASFLLPLLNFKLGLAENLVPSLSATIPTYWLPEMGFQDSGATEPTATGRSHFFSLSGFYLAVAMIFCLLFLFRLFSIVRLIVQSKKYSWKNCVVAESDNEKPTFSFFNFIFIGQAGQLAQDEKEKILQHELVHVRRKHSFDILLINLTGIICWFNPIILLYRKALVQLHEFDADAIAVEKLDVDQYCLLMAKVALQESGFSLGNHFHTSLTIKRITMMKTFKKKIQRWKMAALACALPMVLLVVACQEQMMNDLRTVGNNSASAADFPPEVEAKLNDLKKQSPKTEYIVIELTGDGLKTLEKLKADFAQSGHAYDVILFNTYTKPDGKADRSFAFLVRGETAFLVSDLAIGKDSVYNFVDTNPEYPGGFDSLRSYIIRQLRYPSDARKSGVQGKVFVQFIVEKDGRITHTQVIKGIEPTCDKEALSVVSGMKPWIPGSQKGQAVRVKFVMPVNFKLGG